MSLRELLFGKPLSDAEAGSERLGVASGIPVLGLDALASAAYGPEAALTVLLPLGAAGIGWVGPIVATIAVLLIVVQVSYRQTIGAYPDGGGSYTVSKENLGHVPGLCAAAALCVDYVLNVAVAIAAGVGALTSAIPALHPHTLLLCLALLALLTLTNLRGVRTTGVVFMVPTYLFAGSLLAVIAWGLWKAIAAGGHPAPVVAPAALPAATAAATAWLAVRAFSSGCTALTGIEAVSNAVPVFSEPRRVRAKRTLTAIAVLLVLLLAGIAALSHVFGIGATEPDQPGYQSMLSQMVAAVAGRGVAYGITMSAVVAVLCLSANTSFAGFPRLCRLLALDSHLPEAFAHSGRRLVYGAGIVLLATLAGALLLAFHGVTDRLIPLFAVGAFLAFTLSQSGMVVHWRRRLHEPGARVSLLVNLAGAVLTGATLLVILVSKFTEGAWLSALCVAALVTLFLRTRARYDLAVGAVATHEPLDLEEIAPPLVVVPIRHLHNVTRKALRLGCAMSPEVYAVEVHASDQSCEDASRRWEAAVAAPARRAGTAVPRLVQLRTEYRDVTDPLLRFVRKLASDHPDRFVAVIIPDLVEARWYHYLLFSHTATALRMMFRFRGGPQVVVVDAPWHLRERRHGGGARARAGVVPLAERTAEA